MSKSIFELWTDQFPLGGDKILYKLESCEDRPETGLFLTKERYYCNGREFFDSPVYQVWIDGKRVLACLNYQEALCVWRNRLKELK